MTITSTPRWSLGRGNAVVPSRWQATVSGVKAARAWSAASTGNGGKHALILRHARVGHYVEEHATQLALVAAGLGVTLLPQVGRSPLPPGVVSRPTVPSFPRQLHAAYRTDDAVRPAIRATVAALQEAMRRALVAVS